MSEASIKLIALDIDGTLLNEQGEISKQNYDAIKAAEALGITVLLTTGRTMKRSRDYAIALKLSSYMVTVNGSEIWDENGRLLERTLLHSDKMKELLDVVKEYALPFKAVCTEQMWLNELPTSIHDSSWMALLMFFEDEELRAHILEKLQMKTGIEISNSSPNNIEINAKGINKARAIEKVCQLLHISMDEVLTIGDSLNDLEMIKSAKIGVAMGNAQEVVKDAADWVTESNNNHGVAVAL
ncbi:phosphoglycolate phosphatase, partial [Bacillus massiliigorillae]|uniref:phosphoglycolate phosphatase n=1 Tax=Bacillus massiliigorillae TaxID=1243664 RepID=UPI0005A8E6B3